MDEKTAMAIHRRYVESLPELGSMNPWRQSAEGSGELTGVVAEVHRLVEQIHAKLDAIERKLEKVGGMV